MPQGGGGNMKLKFQPQVAPNNNASPKKQPAKQNPLSLLNRSAMNNKNPQNNKGLSKNNIFSQIISAAGKKKGTKKGGKKGKKK